MSCAGACGIIGKTNDLRLTY
ncbi:hypothetical protein EMIT0P12_10856 [Pseudomonas sp. IT-P12]